MADLRSIRSDLAAEQEALDAVVAPLPPEAWDTPTPSEPWTVRDQISHLAFFDEQGHLAITDPDRFVSALAVVADANAYMNRPLEKGRGLSPDEVLSHWREVRAALLEVSESMDPVARIPWYGPPLKPASFLSGRIMETWAHGQDVADALKLRREPTPRLRHVAHLGVLARKFSFSIRGLPEPPDEILVELRAPGGETWRWGEEGAPDRVSGEALDFCQVVTQRRNIADTNLDVRGDGAHEWMSIAQAYAGPPGEGRAPLNEPGQS